MDMITILQDNDSAGHTGGQKVAEKIYKEFGSIAEIGQWDESLQNKFDVCADDEYLTETKKALQKAIPYKPINEVIQPPKFREGVFVVMTDIEASNTTPKPLEWIVEGVLPKEQNAILAGTTGSKKSYYAMQLGMCVANNETHFMGNRIMVKDFKVLYVDTEIGQDELLRRYHRLRNKMDWEDKGNWVMMSKSGRTVDIWQDVHYIIQNQFKPDLLIIDSLYNSTTVTAFDKSGGISKVTDELCEFKVQYNCSMFTVGHFNKGQNELGLDLQRMSGASQLQNWVEWDILMCKTNVPNFNLWKVGKTRATYHDESIVGLKFNDFWFETVGVVDEPNQFLISEQKKESWRTVLEDLPDRFDTNQWLNVFNSKYPEMSERTGQNWLSSAKATPMVNKISHGIYEKGLGLINEDNIDES